MSGDDPKPTQVDKQATGKKKFHVQFGAVTEAMVAECVPAKQYTRLLFLWFLSMVQNAFHYIDPYVVATSTCLHIKSVKKMAEELVAEGILDRCEPHQYSKAMQLDRVYYRLNSEAFEQRYKSPEAANEAKTIQRDIASQSRKRIAATRKKSRSGVESEAVPKTPISGQRVESETTPRVEPETPLIKKNENQNEDHGKLHKEKPHASGAGAFSDQSSKRCETQNPLHQHFLALGIKCKQSEYLQLRRVLEDAHKHCWKSDDCIAQRLFKKYPQLEPYVSKLIKECDSKCIKDWYPPSPNDSKLPEHMGFSGHEVKPSPEHKHPAKPGENADGKQTQ